MLAIISTVAYSAADPVVLQVKDDTGAKNVALRISRTATLDGGCAIVNDGLSHADRTIQLQSSNHAAATAAALYALVQAAAAVYLGINGETFTGYLSSYREEGATLNMAFMVSSRLSV